MRPSRRQPDELRAVSLERGVVKYAEGSCFVKFGDTHVLVTATLEDRLPPWLKGQARGWVTAEYGMLPRATLERTRREASAGKQSGRTVEIQRLIGRSLRAVRRSAGARRAADHRRLRRDPGRRRHAHRLDHRRLGRAARLHRLDEDARHAQGASPLRDHVAAISCGVCNGTPVLDLDYAEDSRGRDRRQFRHDRRRAASSRCRARPRRCRSPRSSSSTPAGARAQKGVGQAASICRRWR